jgi:hypothetical protein
MPQKVESVNTVAQAIRVNRPYYIINKMNIISWYRNGSLNAFRQFCIQNQGKPVSIKLTNRSEPVVGTEYNYCLNTTNLSGRSLLLTDQVIHPAYYGLEGIESLHIGINEALPPKADNGYSKDMSISEIMASR